MCSTDSAASSSSVASTSSTDATAKPTETRSPLPQGSTSTEDPLVAATERHARLQMLIQLRKLYRNLLRAEPLLEYPSPVYQPQYNLAKEVREAASSEAADETEGSTELDAAALAAAEDAEQQRIDEAVEVVAEMELTAEELRVSAPKI